MSFKLHIPELVGLSVLGATIGALLGGAGTVADSAWPGLGALAGAATPILLATAARKRIGDTDKRLPAATGSASRSKTQGALRGR